jgi:hypothetical protein
MPQLTKKLSFNALVLFGKIKLNNIGAYHVLFQEHEFFNQSKMNLRKALY